MAWTTLKTNWATGELASADDMNAICENLAALRHPATAVAASGSPGTVIYTALSSAAANEWDEIFIQAVNTSASDVKLTVEWGGTDSPRDHIEVTIPAESGFTEVIPGHVLQNGAEARAFAATADVIVLHGYVNRYQHI